MYASWKNKQIVYEVQGANMLRIGNSTMNAIMADDAYEMKIVDKYTDAYKIKTKIFIQNKVTWTNL